MSPAGKMDCSRIEAEISCLRASTGRNRRFCSPHADLDTAVNQKRRVTIRDGRAIHDRFSLDTHGFVFVPHVVMVVVGRIPEGEALQADIPGEEDLPAASIFAYSPDHRWWWFSSMTRDEALFFKFQDSDHSRAWRVPHSAFHNTAAAQANIRRKHRDPDLRVLRAAPGERGARDRLSHGSGDCPDRMSRRGASRPRPTRQGTAPGWCRITCCR